jgi:hypothetical protein
MSRAYRERMLRLWRDPEWRTERLAAIERGRTSEARTRNIVANKQADARRSLHALRVRNELR